MADFTERYVRNFRDQYLVWIGKVRPNWTATNHHAFVRCLFYLHHGEPIPPPLRAETDTVPECILRSQRQPGSYRDISAAVQYLLGKDGPFLGHGLRQQQLWDAGLRGGKYDHN